MQWIYSLLIRCFGSTIWLLSLWKSKPKQWIDGRKNWRENLEKQIPNDKKVIWFHCSSLGEFEQGKPLIKDFKRNYPNYFVALSFFSPSGYEVRKNDPIANAVFYLPLDTEQNAKDIVGIVNPELLVLVKYEYWFHLITEIIKRNRKIIVISAIFRPSQIFFHSFFGLWFRKKISLISHFFVQNQESKKLLNSIGIFHVTVSGDTRFDRVKNLLNEKLHLPKIEKFKGTSKLLIAGSTWAKDSQILLRFFEKNRDLDFKLLVAPHNIKPQDIEVIKNQSSLPFVLFSQLDSMRNSPNKKFMILDTMGMLSKVYDFADFVYIGGGFTKSGVHNVLEAAVYGKPIIIGKNFKKFQEAKDLVHKKGIISIKTYDELESCILELFHNSKPVAKMGEINQNYVIEQSNSSQIILKKISTFLP